MSLEMHCHSMFSVDGRGTPEDLVDVAAGRGITALALTDHNSLGGLRRAREQAETHGMRFLPGVEFDARLEGKGYHFVAVGFDPDDRELSNLAERNFSVYEHTFRLCLEQFEALGYPDLEGELLEGLAARYPGHPAPVINMWYARDVLLESGLVPDRDAFDRLVGDARKRVISDRGPKVFRQFACLEEVLSTVHKAGGILVLAHVAQYLAGNPDAQVAFIRALIEQGLDGFELRHPLNLVEPHFDRLVAEAHNLGCVITGGSDCHDAGQDLKNPIGQCDVSCDLLDRIDEAISTRRTELL
jgi:3',5'-nucleoside bisphosphate phosphatase